MGVVSGEMLIDGRQRDSSFQRKTGYVQQQDLHLHTTTVREALTFSALLRQPAKYSKEEKLAYVDTVIGLLNMEEYSEAVIGIPGEGLNVEQRKRLTSGVELVARPQLLLFLDEPTSGLDSQTSWFICDLMEKLTRNGQVILCTIHQPSAMLFQRFNRLLLVARGGKTFYFGEVGQDSSVLMDYITRSGGPSLPPGANPAERCWKSLEQHLVTILILTGLPLGENPPNTAKCTQNLKDCVVLAQKKRRATSQTLLNTRNSQPRSRSRLEKLRSEYFNSTGGVLVI